MNTRKRVKNALLSSYRDGMARIELLTCIPRLPLTRYSSIPKHIPFSTSLNSNDTFITTLPYSPRESCHNHPLLSPLMASKNSSSMRLSIHENMVAATNSSCVGLVTAPNTTFGSLLPNSTIARRLTTGIRLVVTDLTRGSFSRLVFDIIFPPWFLMRPDAMSIDAEIFFYLRYFLSPPLLVLISSLGGCKLGLRNQTTISVPYQSRAT